MGAFFSNVQVRGDEQARARLIDALRGAAEEGGADEIGDGEGADRTVLVLPPDEGGWMAVYDEATEGQDTERLDALAELASRALSSTAFTVLVHDSDVLALALFSNGVARDRYDSNPGYFGPRLSKAKRQQLAGAPAVWAPLLVPGASEDDLRRAFAGEETFAEATLGHICALIGCAPTRAQQGHTYAIRLPDALPPGTVRLRFRSRVRPAHEAPNAGLPVFDAYSPYGVQAHTAATGDELRLAYSVRNVGGAAKGLSIVIFGPALVAGLVDVQALELIAGNPSKGAKHRTLSPEKRVSAEGEPLLVLALPEQILAAGRDLSAWRPGDDHRAILEATFDALIHVNVVGRVTGAGTGVLSCAFVPDANREDGAMVGQYDLAVVAPARRPLRVEGDASSESTSAMLRHLADNRYLHALLVIDRPRDVAASFAREAIEAAVSIIGTDGDFSGGIFFREPGKKPRTSTGKAAAMLKGKRLDALLASMATESMVDVSVRAAATSGEESFPPGHGLWGLSFGTSVLADQENARVPTLAAWVDTHALGPAKTAAIRARWAAIIERAMSTDGLQGVIARGGQPSTMDTSTYEQACETPHGIGTARVWAERWVRVPGNDTLWLGTGLATRLDDAARAKLAPIADVAAIGGGLRITLRDPEQAGALEIAIAASLPTREEGLTMFWAFMGRR